MKNHSEYIKSVSKRTLTAKGYKFLNRCIEIAFDNKGYTRYHSEMKPLKEKLSNIIHVLFIDKKMTHTEIADLIKSRRYLAKNNIEETYKGITFVQGRAYGDDGKELDLPKFVTPYDVY